MSDQEELDLAVTCKDELKQEAEPRPDTLAFYANGGKGRATSARVHWVCLRKSSKSVDQKAKVRLSKIQLGQYNKLGLCFYTAGGL